MKRFGRLVVAANTPGPLAGLCSCELFEFRRGVLQVLIEVEGEDGEVAGSRRVFRKSAFDTALAGVADTIELSRIGDGQRAHEDTVYQREDGGIGAYPQSQRDDGGDGKTRRLAQLPHRVAKVEPEVVHRKLLRRGISKSYSALSACMGSMDAARS